jgi:hypothetical protein
MISRPSRCLLQYTASILLCFPRHWVPISAGSCLTPRWWHFKVPTHVRGYWIPIHWMINAVVGFSFTSRKCMVQNAKSFFRLTLLLHFLIMLRTFVSYLYIFLYIFTYILFFLYPIYLLYIQYFHWWWLFRISRCLLTDFVDVDKYQNFLHLKILIIKDVNKA